MKVYQGCWVTKKVTHFSKYFLEKPDGLKLQSFDHGLILLNFLLLRFLLRNIHVGSLSYKSLQKFVLFLVNKTWWEIYFFFSTQFNISLNLFSKLFLRFLSWCIWLLIFTISTKSFVIFFVPSERKKFRQHVSKILGLKS